MENNKYNLHNYIYGKDIINSIIIRLNKEDISDEEEINLINSIADFIQNNIQYEYLESFNELADVVVDIIEAFNTENIDRKNRIDNLIRKILNFKKDIDNVKINLYFYGKDKYNIIDKYINTKVIHIYNINDYLNTEFKTNSIDVLILSEETTDNDLDFNLYFNDVLYYDKLMNNIFDISERIYYQNYNYNYLMKSFDKCKCEDIDTLVVGNSYPLTGIHSNLLNKSSVNLSLSSQDLYYSYKIAEEIINENKNIKRCIIGVGYFLFNHDLSRCKSEYSCNMLKYVYYPALKDKHNSEKVDSIELLNLRKVLNNDILDYIFNLELLHKHFTDLIFKVNNGYFNQNYTRERHSMLSGVKLGDISEEEKYRLGQCRANEHNDLFKYTATKIEYTLIFDEFIKFLDEKSVEPIIVIFPKTKYYSKFVNKMYEYEFYKVINSMKEKYSFKIIDFSKIDIFEENDFIDFDHLAESGAIKVTNKLNEILI